MAFKIVMFLKRRKNQSKMQVAFVPEKWEQDGNIFWPQKNAEKLREISTSTPEEDWFKYRGIIKKDKIRSLDEAKLWEEEIVNAENTEDEANIIVRKNMKTSTKKNSSSKIFNKSSSDEENEYENAFENCRNNTVETEVLQAHPVDTPIQISYFDDLSNVQEVINGLANGNYEELKTEISHLKKDNELLKDIVYSMDSRLKTVLAVVEKTYEKVTNIDSNGINQGNEKMVNKDDEYDAPQFDDKFIFPINQTETLLSFNREILNSTEYRKFLIERFTKIGGVEGKEDGQKIGRNLLSILFTTELLTKYSWTGISRTTGINKKLPFQSLDGIINFFCDIIGKADCKWSEQANIKFFKMKILKHANKINETFEKNKSKKKLTLQESNKENITASNNTEGDEDESNDNDVDDI